MQEAETPPLDLERNESLIRVIRSDRARYWRDHAVMAGLGMAGIVLVLLVIGNPHVVIGALGAGVAIAVRGAYLASEQLSQRWWLTDRRVILPGARSVHLAQVAKARKILGDVQLVTVAGDKYLIKHVASPDDLVAQVMAARDARRRARG